jgi:Domain of unknown function (DUF1707)
MGTGSEALVSEGIVAAGYEMRVSDAERDAAAAELREHFASGRLNQDELDERLTAAFAAKTGADLNALFTDLPSNGPAWGSGSAPDGARTGAGPVGASPFAGGPFGPFGGGPFGAGPFGPGGGSWAAAGRSDAGGGWQGHGPGWRPSAGRMIGRVVLNGVLVWVLFILGILGVFGIGAGRPLGVVLIVFAFALLRRLVFILIGRRLGRGSGRRGPRGRR